MLKENAQADVDRMLASTPEENRAMYISRIESRQVLAGHTSPETAYVVADYPYGFRLRCQKRYWLEFRLGYGFRMAEQTSNPKKPGLVWNKPKKGNYHDFALMVLDEDGHVALHTASAGGWTPDEVLDAFETFNADALTDEHRKMIRYIRATNRASKYVKVEVKINSGEPRQTDEDRSTVLRAALAQGYRDLAQEGT